MGVIKTALEIALEKTENVKSDKTGILQFDAKQRGKKAANEFLANNTDLEQMIKKEPDELKDSLKQGIFDVLYALISLPASKDDENRLEAIGKGLSLVIKNKDFTALYGQFMQLMSRYIEEAGQYEQAIRQQYAPKLRQKEEELSRRIGTAVRLDPMQDPEFVAFFNQNMNALKSNYEAVIEQVKQQIAVSREQ